MKVSKLMLAAVAFAAVSNGYGSTSQMHQSAVASELEERSPTRGNSQDKRASIDNDRPVQSPAVTGVDNSVQKDFIDNLIRAKKTVRIDTTSQFGIYGVIKNQDDTVIVFDNSLGQNEIVFKANIIQIGIQRN
ncbi:MAG: hypothetical protein HEEMFOPI_01613 [Holosporales bacterium]